MTRLYKKQYVLSSRKLDFPQMVCLELQYGYLYIDNDLTFLQANDKKGRFYIVIGNVFCTDKYPKQILDDIKLYEGDSIIELTNNWTGRWLLIQDSCLITDTTGLMSAFYWKDNNNWLVSSSLSLLSNILKISIAHSVSDKGLDWHLLPDTIIPGVNALFCTQQINLVKGIEIIPIDRFTDKRYLTSEMKVKDVNDRLVVALKNIEKYSGRNILIALTAGKDSRLVLSAALSAKVKFSTYTMEHPKMILADKNLPGKIASKYGFKWDLIKMGEKNALLADDYLHFNGGNSKGADIIFYTSGQHQQLSGDAIVIRSGIFEAGQQYGRRTMGNTPESLRCGFFKYYKTSLKRGGQKESFERWECNAKQYPIEFIDIRDRFYIEQRVNGWVSAIEQALTINDFDTLQIANCQAIISTLLSATEEERYNNHLAYRMIQSLVPDLLNYPVNKQTIVDKFNVMIRGIFNKFF